jgi:protein SSD1
MEHQQNQPAPQGGVPGPTGRRLHIAHRRSPSELTPLMSMFSSPGSKSIYLVCAASSSSVVISWPGQVASIILYQHQHYANTYPSTVEQLAIQQQIELLQQQQQQIQATHQQYVNMGMIPPTQHLAPGGGYNPLQPQMQNLSPQSAYQFPNQMPQQQQPMNAPMGAPTQPLSHRRNQSALPNMGMGPPPAPSSGAAGSSFGDFGGHNRENSSTRGGRGGGPPGGGHQRRHSLALPEAKKAAELAQQKRTTSGFQFPIPGAAGATPTSAERTESPSGEDKNTAQSPSVGNHVVSGANLRGRGSGHGRSQSMAVGANGRGGSAMRGGGSFQFPPMQATPDAGASGQGNDFQRRGSSTGHNRSSSRNFEGNWRNQPPQGQSPQDQQGSMGNFQGQGQPQGGFQPGHRNRGSVNQSISNIGNFQYSGQPQLVQLPQGQMALVPQQLYPGQQLNPLQMNQLQALQAAQMNGQVGLQGSQHAPQLSAQQQQQQRKTLFTPYLPQATLPALLGDGQLVSGILRVNKKNRSDAYVTTQDGLLDADIFICGSKDRNRALEGDLVAVELLDVDEVWGQKREKEEKKKRKDITDTRTSGSTNGNSNQSHRDNSTNGDEQPSAGDGGIRRRGSLRQRPTQKKNDDVEVEGQSLLLVEEEEVNDEQKPLYAGHIVAVVERVAGQMFSGTLGLLRPSSQATKEKQEAERQARDGNNNRHQESRQQDKPKIVWFKPTE